MATIVKNKNLRKGYTVRYQHHGKQREKSFVTRREANDFKADFEFKSRAQIFMDPAAGSVRFSTAAERWVSRLTGAPSSAVRYRTILAHHINPVMGNRSLRDVANDRDALQDFLLEAMPARGQGISQMRAAYLVVRAVVNDAVRAGKIPSSKINGISLPSQSATAQIVFPSFEELSSLSGKMPEPFGLLIWLMRGCGLRVSEALAVRWENFTDGTLRVTEQLLPSGEYGPLKHRKPGEFRDVPVPGYVSDWLAQTPRAPGIPTVFPRVHYATFGRWFARAREASGIAGHFTPHTLRHIFASVSLSNGVPITDVSTWLGHRNINMTYSIYGHLVPSSWGKARAVLDTEYTNWKEAG